MWGSIGKLLARAAIWALGHPDEVIKVVEAVKK